MPTYKTPEELRAWSRSFKRSKTSIIKRWEYNYEDPNSKEEENKEDIAADILNNIKSERDNSLNSLFDMNEEDISKMNSEYPSTQEQMEFSKNSKLIK